MSLLVNATPSGVLMRMIYVHSTWMCLSRYSRFDEVAVISDDQNVWPQRIFVIHSYGVVRVSPEMRAAFFFLSCSKLMAVDDHGPCVCGFPTPSLFYEDLR